jgi:hypothetical protein
MIFGCEQLLFVRRRELFTHRRIGRDFFGIGWLDRIAAGAAQPSGSGQQCKQQHPGSSAHEIVFLKNRKGYGSCRISPPSREPTACQMARSTDSVT